MRRTLQTCVISLLLLAACSSSKSNDFFEHRDPASASASNTTGASSTTVSTTTSAGTSSADESSSSASSTTSGSGGSSPSGNTAATGGGTATSDGDGGTTGAGASGGTSTTVTSGSGGTDAAGTDTVELELESGSDCVEVSCPEEAPYAVACDITFNTPGPLGFACVAIEEAGLIYIQSGTSCYGTQIESGSITCSSEAPGEPLSTASCVAHNKPGFAVVEERCDCDADVPGCFGFESD